MLRNKHSFELHELIFAQQLGVDLEEQHASELIGLAVVAMKSLPNGFELCFDSSNGSLLPYFHNTTTGNSDWNHPNQQIYANLIRNKRKEFQRNNPPPPVLIQICDPSIKSSYFPSENNLEDTHLDIARNFEQCVSDKSSSPVILTSVITEALLQQHNLNVTALNSKANSIVQVNDEETNSKNEVDSMDELMYHVFEDHLPNSKKKSHQNVLDTDNIQCQSQIEKVDVEVVESKAENESVASDENDVYSGTVYGAVRDKLSVVLSDVLAKTNAVSALTKSVYKTAIISPIDRVGKVFSFSPKQSPSKEVVRDMNFLFAVGESSGVSLANNGSQSENIKLLRQKSFSQQSPNAKIEQTIVETKSGDSQDDATGWLLPAHSASRLLGELPQYLTIDNESAEVTKRVIASRQNTASRVISLDEIYGNTEQVSSSNQDTSDGVPHVSDFTFVMHNNQDASSERLTDRTVMTDRDDVNNSSDDIVINEARIEQLVCLVCEEVVEDEIDIALVGLTLEIETPRSASWDPNKPSNADEPSIVLIEGEDYSSTMRLADFLDKSEDVFDTHSNVTSSQNGSSRNSRSCINSPANTSTRNHFCSSNCASSRHEDNDSQRSIFSQNSLNSPFDSSRRGSKSRFPYVHTDSSIINSVFNFCPSEAYYSKKYDSSQDNEEDEEVCDEYEDNDDEIGDDESECDDDVEQNNNAHISFHASVSPVDDTADLIRSIRQALELDCGDAVSAEDCNECSEQNSYTEDDECDGEDDVDESGKQGNKLHEFIGLSPVKEVIEEDCMTDTTNSFEQSGELENETQNERTLHVSALEISTTEGYETPRFAEESTQNGNSYHCSCHISSCKSIEIQSPVDWIAAPVNKQKDDMKSLLHYLSQNVKKCDVSVVDYLTKKSSNSPSHSVTKNVSVIRDYKQSGDVMNHFNSLFKPSTAETLVRPIVSVVSPIIPPVSVKKSLAIRETDSAATLLQQQKQKFQQRKHKSQSHDKLPMLGIHAPSFVPPVIDHKLSPSVESPLQKWYVIENKFYSTFKKASRVKIILDELLEQKIKTLASQPTADTNTSSVVSSISSPTKDVHYNYKLAIHRDPIRMQWKIECDNLHVLKIIHKHYHGGGGSGSPHHSSLNAAASVPAKYDAATDRYNLTHANADLKPTLKRFNSHTSDISLHYSANSSAMNTSRTDCVNYDSDGNIILLQKDTKVYDAKVVKNRLYKDTKYSTPSRSMNNTAGSHMGDEDENGYIRRASLPILSNMHTSSVSPEHKYSNHQSYGNGFHVHNEDEKVEYGDSLFIDDSSLILPSITSSVHSNSTCERDGRQTMFPTTTSKRKFKPASFHKINKK